jgi:LmbE family N-acetylglucosaminyl deacetylase
LFAERCGRSLLALCCMAATLGGQVRYKSNLAIHNVFIVAHQDDWQVFMGDVASTILRSGTRATFIYLTAGDDGRDSVYWRTRELAALRSTQVAMGRPAGADGITCMSVTVTQHAVGKCSLGNVDSYFLRLPDGRRNGAGFSQYGHQSLRLLRAKKIPAITTVDGSSAYHSWSDLVTTVVQVVDDHSGEQVLVHTTDPSKVANPHDHFDHRMAGLLVEELRNRYGLAVRYYTGYALASRAPNRTSAETRVKTAVFLAYDAEMMRVNKGWSAFSEHRAFYSQCMERTYARTPRARPKTATEKPR